MYVDSIDKMKALLILLVFSMAIHIQANDNKTQILNPFTKQQTMSKASDYIDKYAEAAMDQMRRYGIPASVTLAQGIIESASGQSDLSKKGNNHFGIKATKTWLENGGRYLVYTDDKPNEKFCQYASVADSFEHHSLFLKNNTRYASLFALSPDNYQGWTEGLQRAGYASSKTYAASLQNVIKTYGLDKYDASVMQENGWKQSDANNRSSENLAKNSKQEEASTDQVSEVIKSEEKETEETNNKNDDKSFFNSIFSSTDNENVWENFFGSNNSESSSASLDPIIDLASTLFASLMAMAIQIDDMGQSVQQNQSQPNEETYANVLASKNFDMAFENTNDRSIKRTRI